MQVRGVYGTRAAFYCVHTLSLDRNEQKTSLFAARDVRTDLYIVFGVLLLVEMVDSMRCAVNVCVENGQGRISFAKKGTVLVAARGGAHS